MKQIRIQNLTIDLDLEENLSTKQVMEWFSYHIGNTSQINKKNPLCDSEVRDFKINWVNIEIKNINQ